MDSDYSAEPSAGQASLKSKSKSFRETFTANCRDGKGAISGCGSAF